MHFHIVKLPGRELEAHRRCHEDEATCPLGQATPEEIGWFYHSVNPNQEIGNFGQWLLERRGARMTISLGSDEIRRRFGFRKKTTERDADVMGVPATAPLHRAARIKFEEFANFLDEMVPEGRAKSIMFTQLEDTSMWAHKAISERAPLSSE